MLLILTVEQELLRLPEPDVRLGGAGGGGRLLPGETPLQVGGEHLQHVGGAQAQEEAAEAVAGGSGTRQRQRRRRKIYTYIK